MLPWWGREVDRPVDPVAPAACIDELGRSTGLGRDPMAPDEFVARCCSILDVSFEALADRGKGRNISRMRYLIAALAIERWGLTAKQLGELLGRWPEAVSRWASRGADMRLSSREFLQEYEALDQTLAGQSKKPAVEGKKR